jgi:hypothetical protein
MTAGAVFESHVVFRGLLTDEAKNRCPSKKLKKKKCIIKNITSK